MHSTEQDLREMGIEMSGRHGVNHENWQL